VDARVTVMVAEAERNSRTTRGEGDALAAKVYAEAYNKNAEFFSFVRSLEAYNRSFNSKSDVLVVQPDSDFFQYMKSQQKN
jgi:membrane protease subunit HflC